MHFAVVDDGGVPRAKRQDFILHQKKAFAGITVSQLKTVVNMGGNRRNFAAYVHIHAGNRKIRRQADRRVLRFRYFSCF